MNINALLVLPMIALVCFTFGVMFWMLKLRIKAVREDGLDPRYFKLYKGAETPEYVEKVTQHYQNLLEMPPLLYIAVILVLVLNMTDYGYVFLSWAFLITRLVHSYVHLGSNKILWRMWAFLSSMLVLMLLWLKIAFDVVSL